MSLVIKLCDVMLNVSLFYFYSECHYSECHYADCHFAECHYVECHYTEYHYAECRGTHLTAELQRIPSQL
jgi:hypothetical protein